MEKQRCWQMKESDEVDSQAAIKLSIDGSVFNYSNYQPSKRFLRIITKQARDIPNTISARRTALPPATAEGLNQASIMAP